MMNLRTAAIGLVLSFTPLAQGALPPLKITGDQGSVRFLAVGKPSFLKIKGSAMGPTGSLELKDGQWQGAFEFDLTRLDTGIDLRDTHMKEKYLEVSKHPKAMLTLAALVLPADWKPTNTFTSELPFSGELELHGEKRPVTGTASIRSSTQGTDVTAKFAIKISDFKVDLPKYAGISVADNVDIEVALRNLK